MWCSLPRRTAKVIDLSADFRLQDADEWAKWYGQPHGAPALLDEAVYGLPEVNREKIRQARLIAVPGCYPTATQLGFLPLLEAGLADTSLLIADCKSGISGAGRGASVGSLYSETSESFKAYAVKGHRHLPEIRQGLRRAAGKDVGLTFVPHLTPPAGSHPETRSVRGANVCRIAVHRPQDGDLVVVLSVIDNLVKGASGQAVQNLNILFGLDERLGLSHAGMLP